MRGLHTLTMGRKKLSIEQIKENSYCYDTSPLTIKDPLCFRELSDNIFMFKHMIKHVDHGSQFDILFPDNTGKGWVIQTFDSDGNPK